MIGVEGGSRSLGLYPDEANKICRDCDAKKT